MKKKILTVAGMIYFGMCCMLLCGVTANAYVDPSVITYVIQAVAGIGIAVAAAVGIYWRKAKKKINNKLGIDENRNKTVETDDIVINDEEK